MTAFNKSLPKPAWLLKEHENKNTQRGQRYYLQIWNAQPDWADVNAIRRIYKQARQMRREGYDVEVDHVIPLINDYICGLHVPLNLKIVPRLYNAKKSNRTYPGMEYEQRDLLENVVAPPDWDLVVQ